MSNKVLDDSKKALKKALVELQITAAQLYLFQQGKTKEEAKKLVRTIKDAELILLQAEK